MPSSYSPLVQDWLAVESQNVYAVARAHRGLLTVLTRREWPWRLIVVDIYGRAGRWVKAADAFDAFVGESFGKATSTNNHLGRLPLPDEPGGDLMTADGAAAAAELWASSHPSPLAHAVTSYIKLSKVDGATRTLSFLRACLAAGSAECCGDPGRNGKLSETDEEELPLGPPDPAWLDVAVRGFGRLGRWDLAAAALSPEICEWVSADTEARSQRGDQEVVERKTLEVVLASLKSFLEHKGGVKRPAEGQVEGARACLEVLVGFETDLFRGSGAKDDTGLRPTAVGATEATTSEQFGGYASERSPLPLPSSALPQRDVRIDDDKASGKKSDLDVATETVKEQNRRAVYAEALRWLPDVEPKRDKAAWAPEPLSRSAESLGDSNFDDGADAASMALLLRCRSAGLTQEALLGVVRQAWLQDSLDGGADTKERRRSAAFALYEAGMESGTLADDVHWTSTTAGVMDLYCRDYRESRAVPLAALNLVLTDMLRRHAYGQEVRYPSGVDVAWAVCIVAKAPVGDGWVCVGGREFSQSGMRRV